MMKEATIICLKMAGIALAFGLALVVGSVLLGLLVRWPF